jgi:hypothetical protein
VEGRASTLGGDYYDEGRECFIGFNIKNQSKMLFDIMIHLLKGKYGHYPIKSKSKA